MKRTWVLVVAGGVAVLGASVASAAIITWGTAQNITGDSDVSLEGPLVRADGGAQTATVNGVLFQDTLTTPSDPFTNSPEWGGYLCYATLSSAVDSITQPQVDGAESWGMNRNDGPFAGSYYPPFNTLSGDYQTILKSAVSTGLGTATMTLGGLSTGQAYLVQLWAHDARYNVGTRSQIFDGNESTVMTYAHADNEGSLGQYIIGRFTADATTQSFTITSGESVMVNAYQLRAVPEPATICALFGIAVPMLLKRRAKP